MIESSRGISIRPSSNNIPSSSSYDPGRKIKALPEEKSDDESPVGIGGDYSLSPLVIGGYLNMGNVSGGNGSMNSHTLSKQDRDFNNGDESSGNGFINSHTLYQCNDSSALKEMGVDVENGDISGGHGSMNSHTLYQQNFLKPLINSNNRDDVEINYD